MGGLDAQDVSDASIQQPDGEPQGTVCQQDSCGTLERHRGLTEDETLRRFAEFDALHGRIPADVDITAIIRLGRS